MYRNYTYCKEEEKTINIEQSDYGQGLGAAPEAYFAGQSMERVRRGTAESPVFAPGKNGPWIMHSIITKMKR